MTAPIDDELAAIQETAAAWFARGLGDPLTGEERAALETWLQADPRHRAEYDLFAHLWSASAQLKPGVGRRRRALGAALAVLAGVLLWRWDAQVATAPDIVTGPARQHLELADGSRLEMAPNTRLRVSMDGPTRRIELDTGQIVVTVADDRYRPFEVLSGGGRIRDIGTRFEVDATPQGTWVTVAEGAVDISMLSGVGVPVRVKAGQAAAFGPGGVSPARPVNAEAALGWTRGRLEFDAVPLAQVVRALNRYRRVPVELSDPQLGAVRISGVFLVDEAEGMLQAIAQVAPVEFVDEGTRILARRPAPR